MMAIVKESPESRAESRRRSAPRSSTCSPSIAVMTSPARRPAAAATVSSSTCRTRTPAETPKYPASWPSTDSPRIPSRARPAREAKAPLTTSGNPSSKAGIPPPYEGFSPFGDLHAAQVRPPVRAGPLPRGHVHREPRPIAQHGRGHGPTGRRLPNHPRQLPHAANAFAIELDEDVAGLDARDGRRGTVDHLRDDRPFRRGGGPGTSFDVAHPPRRCSCRPRRNRRAPAPPHALSRVRPRRVAPVPLGWLRQWPDPIREPPRPQESRRTVPSSLTSSA